MDIVIDVLSDALRGHNSRWWPDRWRTIECECGQWGGGTLEGVAIDDAGLARLHRNHVAECVLAALGTIAPTAAEVAAMIRDEIANDDDCIQDEEMCFEKHPVHLMASSNGVAWLAVIHVEKFAEMFRMWVVKHASAGRPDGTARDAPGETIE